MIIVRLMGGLGNQMFQYAFGRYLSIKNDTELKFDDTWFPKSNQSRKFMLDIFNVDLKMAGEAEINDLKFRINNSLINKLFKKIRIDNILYKKTYYKENNNQSGTDLLHINIKKGYFDGYWQSEKYFKEIQGIIKKDFTIRIKPDKKTVRLLNEIKKVNSVSIHVRRGDYVNNSHTNAYHGVCSLEYYRNAVGAIKKKLKNPVFYIFSDDTEWVRNEMKLDIGYKIVEGNCDYDDFRLMRHCSHHITANSSFSWWAAWLSVNRNKIVVCPSKWFNAPVDTADLIPQGWIQI